MDLFEIVGRLSLQGVDEANSDLNGITNTAKQSSGIFGSTGSKIAAALGGAFATAKLVNFGKDIISTTQTFSDSMRKVQSLSGASGDELQKLNDIALQYGSTTAWTSSQVADAMGYMALAGFDTNKIVSALPGTLGLASASGTDLAVASDILTDALTAFGYKAEDAGKFADVLATTQAKSNTTVEMLGEAFKYVAPLAGTYGYNVESVSTALGMMANAGIKGSMAGTSMASIITRLATNTSGARDQIEALGIEFYNSDGTARDLSDVLTELCDATSGMTSEQKAQIASTVAGQEAQKGLLAILNQGSGAYEDLEDKLRNCEGAASDMSGTMESGIGGAIRTVQSAWEGFKIKLGQKFETPLANTLQKLAKFVTDKLTPAMEGLIDTVGNVITWFEKHQKVVQACINIMKVLITTFIAFKAGAAIQSVVQGFQSAQVALSLFKLETQGASIAQGLLNGQLTIGQTVVGLLTGKVTLAEIATGLWSKAQAVLNAVMSANPIALVVAAVAALIAIFVIAYNKSEGFRNAIGWLWEKIKGFGEALVEFAMSIPQKIVEAISAVKTFFTETIPTTITNAKNKAVSIIKAGIDKIIDFFSNLPENLGYLLGLALGTVAKFAVDLAAKAIEAGKQFLENIVNFFKELPGKVSEFLGSCLSAVGKWVTNMVAKAKDLAVRFVSAVINGIKSLPGKIKSTLTNSISNVANFAKDMGTKGREAATNLGNNIVNGVKSLPSKLTSIGKNLVQGLWNGITSAGSWLKDKIGGFCSGVIGGFKKAFGINSPSRVMKKEIGAFLMPGVAEAVDDDTSAEKAMQNKVNSILGVADGLTDMSISPNINSVVGESPMQKYQVDFNAQLSSLSDSFDRLLLLVGQYLPGIANNMDREIVLNGDALAIGMSRKMDEELGKLAVSKGRGNV